MPELESLDEPLTLLLPELGEVDAIATLRCDLATEGADWRWKVLRRPAGRPLVLQLACTSPGGWPLERATAWELPRWSEPFEERLRAARTAGEVRAVLGGGIQRERLLYEVCGEEEPEEAPARDPAWSPCEVDAIPRELAEVAPVQAARLAESLRIALDVSPFEPLRAASGSGCYEHMGIGVIGYQALRIAGPVRFGGADALLIAEAVIDETEDRAAAIRGWPSLLRIVPWTGAGAAAEAVVADDPGFRLPGPVSGAPD